MKITDSRPLVVAFHNSRLVLMERHADCVEFRARAEFDGQIWKHTALVYSREDAWFCLISSELENNGSNDTITFDAEAFLTPQGAMKHAVAKVSTLQGKRSQ